MNCSRLDALIREQESLSVLNRKTIRQVQLRKLNLLLARERERGGFYSALPAELTSLEELSELPFTTEEDLAHRAPGMLLCSQSEISRVLSDATSGTTGAAKRVFYTERDLENTVSLYTAGLGELIFPGSVTMICFPFSGPFGLGELIAEAVTRLGAKPLKLGPFLCYGEYCDILETEKPDSFVGMPVQLLSLLRVCGRRSLRRALVSGDACPESVIRGCEELLGSELFPHYGSREMGMAGAITCQAHAGMHLRENCIIAEIVDPEGSPLPPGEPGELVITTIGMEALPLIRYRTGDFTRILPGTCPCGSETLRLDRLTRTPDGSGIAALDEAVFSLGDVADARYTLSEKGIRIELQTCGESEPEALAEALRSRLPMREILLSASKARMEDRPLCPGKRILRKAPLKG